MKEVGEKERGKRKRKKGGEKGVKVLFLFLGTGWRERGKKGGKKGL